MASGIGRGIAREWRLSFAQSLGLLFAVLASGFLLGFFAVGAVARDMRGALLLPVAAGLGLAVIPRLPLRLRRSAQVLAICCAPVLVGSHLGGLHAAPAPSRMRPRLHRARLEYALVVFKNRLVIAN